MFKTFFFIVLPLKIHINSSYNDYEIIEHHKLNRPKSSFIILYVLCIRGSETT